MLRVLKHLARITLGGALLFTGTAHLTQLESFRAQVPPWMPWPEAVIIVSGVMEWLLGLALIFAPRRHRARVGLLTALFFLAIFPGNISQYVTHSDAFGLNTDRARLIRLFFQPLLMLWAWWSTRETSRRR